VVAWPTPQHRVIGIDWGEPRHAAISTPFERFARLSSHISRREKMINKILMVGALACLSAVAMAQSDGNAGNTPQQGQSATSRDAASGLPSGKRMHKPVAVQDSSKGTPSGGSADRESSQPSVSEVVVTKPATESKPVATGDVNGDGMPDVAATSGSAKSGGQNAAGNSNGAHDAASGQATGKRQHEPMNVSLPAPKPKQ